MTLREFSLDHPDLRPIQEAWQALERSHYPIVLTDWSMPRLSGIELVQRIRGRLSSDYTYIIMLTGRSETDDIVSGMAGGALPAGVVIELDRRTAIEQAVAGAEPLTKHAYKIDLFRGLLTDQLEAIRS